MCFYEYLGRQFRQGWTVEGGGGEWLRFPSWARMSSERGVRSAECGVRPADVCGARRECGVRPAGVCGAGRCLWSWPRCPRSAECGVRTADCGADRSPMSAERARSAEYCVVRSTEFCSIFSGHRRGETNGVVTDTSVNCLAALIKNINICKD